MPRKPSEHRSTQVKEETPKSRQGDSLAETWLHSLKSKPLIAVLILATVAITGIATLSDSISKITTQIRGIVAAHPFSKHRQEDLRLEHLLVGTWRPSATPSAPKPFKITDIYYTYLPEGIVNVGGEYAIGDSRFPIMVSSSWQVKEGLIHYKVNSSNVPLVVKEGFSSSYVLIEITKNKMIYRDTLDQKVREANREKQE